MFFQLLKVTMISKWFNTCSGLNILIRGLICILQYKHISVLSLTLLVFKLDM
jgi:hypothetical protein